MIDILMATYNGEKFIKEQLDSILNQSFVDWKLYIHDDGSTDRTVEIINRYAADYPEQIAFVNDEKKTGGAKYNFWHLIQNSNADYIMLADQDDIWEKDKIFHAYTEMRNYERRYENVPILLHTDLKVVDENLNMMDKSFFDMQKLDKERGRFNDVLVQNNVTGCTSIMNRALKEKCKNMPEEAIMHDWWLALVASCFGVIGHIDYTDILYRQHGNNTEGAKNLKSIGYLLKKLFSKKDVREALTETYEQAARFYDEYKNEMDEDKKEVIEAYLTLSSGSKLKKYSILKKYGFMKSGFARKLGYILYI